MKNVFFKLVALCLLLSFNNASAEIKTATDGDYTYEYVEGDPLKARIYTLDNGLKIYLSVFKDEPRIQTFIPVKTGSKNDPADATGLAHYLEHMLFKGTDEMGTSNWEEEQKILKAISDLYEKRRTVTDEAERKAIYEQIDSLSYEASKLAIPNEYDKMISSMGAKYTNAFTSTERTVYMNDIPSNQLEKWLKVESERFTQLVLRLFHTELETVYEEFNISQDRESSKVMRAMRKELYPNHPYGTQTTIGTGEHLKNPSMEKIHEYFTTYYVPNNMAVCLSGDLDFTETVKLVDKYFGSYEQKPVPQFKMPVDVPVTEIKEVEVKGKEAAYVEFGFKFPGINTKDSKLVQMVDAVLANGQAGLIDLNLKQSQKVLDAGCWYWADNDYTTHVLTATPKEGQTLEEARDLLLAEIEKVKKGDFDEGLLAAIVKDYKYSEIKQFERNYGRSFAMVNAFTSNMPWDNYVARFDDLAAITKQEVVDFANEHYGDNYVLVYKQQGDDNTAHKVEKPEITPVDANREEASAFIENFNKMNVENIPAAFLDYDADIQKATLNNELPFYYIKNKLNETFSVFYIFDMGKNHDKEMALAIEYLPFLGTSKYTAAELKQQFYALGLNFDVSVQEESSYVQLRGLNESFKEGVELFEHILENVVVDEKAYVDMVSNVLKSREDDKAQKNKIMWRGLMNYGIYGKDSPFTNILSEEELKSIDPEDLVAKIKSLTGYKHKVFYYGTQPMELAQSMLKKMHQPQKDLMEYPEEIVYTPVDNTGNNVYFVNYDDMVQAQILMTSKEKQYDKALAPYLAMFNEYFGSGLSSIVFQEIRETKGLAYSAFSRFTNPREKEDYHITQGYVGTQADKLPDAVNAIQEIMNEMPVAEKQFEGAKESVLKKIETDRITRSSVYWNYETAQKRGLDYDIRKDVYETVKNMTIEDLEKFFNENIKGNNYNIMIMSDRDEVDLDYIKTMGNYKELTLEEVFNY